MVNPPKQLPISNLGPAITVLQSKCVGAVLKRGLLYLTCCDMVLGTNVAPTIIRVGQKWVARGV
jgi:hypothetical protein